MSDFYTLEWSALDDHKLSLIIETLNPKKGILLRNY